MDTEFEAKFYPVNKEEYRKKLQEIGAELVVPERKMRRVIFNHRVNSQIKCHYLRVRDEGNVIRLSAKTHAEERGQLSDQKEIDIEVSDFDKAVDLLKLANLTVSGYQESLRETWKFDGVEIVIDTWPCLDPYTEIEAESEEKVREVAEMLGFKWEEKIITASPEIMEKVYGISIEEILKMVTHLTFENNPFNGLTRKAWKDIIRENK